MDKKIIIIMIAIIVAVVAIGADKNEYSFNQSIKSVNGKDYKNIEIKVNFYKGNNLLDSYESKINSTKDGKFNLKFTKELSQEPDAFYYDVVSATEV